MKKYPYQDSRYTVEERLDDLLPRMTMEEKLHQIDQYSIREFVATDAAHIPVDVDLDGIRKKFGSLSVGSIQARNVGPQITNAVQKYAVEQTRLGIPYLFSEEALHCFTDPNATCFPQQIGLAATFDPSYGYKMGRAIASEVRSYGVCETFSPVMDLARDPRYGRTEETYGEDTHLSAEFARETVLGLQGDSLTAPDTVAAEPKHYVGYGNPIGGLNCAPSTMGRHDVLAYCMPVFEAAFADAHATDTMCSYNAIDGTPVAMDHELLTTYLRDKFGMPGFVRSDMTAVSMLHTAHAVADSKKEAIRLGVTAGVDLQLYDFPHDVWQDGIRELIAEGKLEENVLDEACGRVLRVKFMCGLFDHPYVDESLNAKVVHCEAHQQLAREIAEEGAVLLKNEKNLLPLSVDAYRKIAVIGPQGEMTVLGDYSNGARKEHCVTLAQGIQNLLKKSGSDTQVAVEKGCSILSDDIKPMNHWWMRSEDGEHGFTARYYNGAAIDGEPVVTRLDQQINFNWIYTKPHPDVDTRQFCVLWHGTLVPPETFTGNLGLSSLDSMRLYVDGKLLVDGWGEGKDANQMVPFTFTRGKEYDIRIEYRNDMRGVRVIFGYNRGNTDFSAALEAAKDADLVIAAMGDSSETSGENFDRVSLDLPGQQLDLLKAVYEVNPNIVLVMQSGRPASITWEQDHIPAIVNGFFPGEKGGDALARILFGEVNPSGRLPYTFPRTVGQIPCHYGRFPAGGKRYVEMDWNPLYPFGYGLSYTTFAYSRMKLSAHEIPVNGSVDVTFTVTNTGDRFGKEVAQVYIHDSFSSTVKPIKELAGFEKVALAPGESKQVTITIGYRQLRTLTAGFEWVVEPGEFSVYLGNNAANVLDEDTFIVK